MARMEAYHMSVWYQSRHLDFAAAFFHNIIVEHSLQIQPRDGHNREPSRQRKPRICSTKVAIETIDVNSLKRTLGMFNASLQHSEK